MSSRMQRYHLELFRWHCRTFFPLHEVMTRAEKAYLDVCFSLPEDYSEATEGGYEGLSYYTYSHRVAGTEVNSSRIAYGTVLHPDEALAAARPVLEERGVDVVTAHDPKAGLLFYGLGWDFDARHFKVYQRALDVAALRPLHPELFLDEPERRHREGLMSYTFVDGALVERKVYFLPEAAGADAVVMRTDVRGDVPQHDDASSPDWLERLNQTGRDIVARYAEIDEPLDTLQWDDPDHFTLYFP